MRISFQLVTIVVLAAVALAMGIALFRDEAGPAPPPRTRTAKPPRLPLPASPATTAAALAPRLMLPASPPTTAAALAPQQDRRTLILTRYATMPDLRSTSGPELGGSCLHAVLDDATIDDPLLIAGAIVMHQAQNHAANSPTKCWNKAYVDKMMLGVAHYSPRNAQLMAANLWNFKQVEGGKDLALSLLMPHNHLQFTDQRLRAEFHSTIGLCKRGNPRYPLNEARREFRSGSTLYEELGEHAEAARLKLEEIKVIMDGDDAVRDQEELRTAFAACATLLQPVAKEDALWGRYRFIEGRFHRDLHMATRDPAELALSEQLFREAKAHKLEHKASKDSDYYNLLTIHAEACLLLAVSKPPAEAGSGLQTAIDELLELVNGNCSELNFQEYSYALKLLETAYIKSQKLPLYIELLQQHERRTTDAPGLAAAMAMERERIRRLMERRPRTSGRRSDDDDDR